MALHCFALCSLAPLPDKLCHWCCRPSLHNQSTAASSSSSPARFMAAVQQCATASQMAVRCLAARSLAPLVPPEALAPMLQQLLTQAQTAIGCNLNAVSCRACIPHQHLGISAMHISLLAHAHPCLLAYAHVGLLAYVVCLLSCVVVHTPMHKGVTFHVLQAHGSLLQAKTLLELNGHTVDSNSLFRAIAPALHTCLPLMHPNSPCATLRNEATLLTAAALALTGLSTTEPVKAYSEEAASLCWLAIFRSTGNARSNSSSTSSSIRISSPAVRSNSQSGNAMPTAGLMAPATTDMSCASDSALSVSNPTARPELPVQAMSDLRLFRGFRDTGSTEGSSPVTSPVYSNAQAVSSKAQQARALSCDSADPVTSLWLKNAALLYFGSSLRMARSVESNRTKGRILMDDIKVALQSSNYDVRAVCLKALVRRALHGEPCSCCCYA